MNTATDRFRRLTLILPSLADGNRASLSELSTKLGIPVEVITGDLHALIQRYDDLAGRVEDIGMIIEGDVIQVRTNHFRRPMRLTLSELYALELGLTLLERERTALASIQSLRGKLAEVIGKLPQDQHQRGCRDGALGGGEMADALAVLRSALRAGVVVAISYQAGHNGAVSERRIHPHRLTFARGTWYLAAWCERNSAPRVFRVDRINLATLTTAPVTTTFDESHIQELDDGTPFIPPSDAPEFTVRYSPVIARWVAERDGRPLETDGSAIRSRPLADREWAIRHVLQYGPEAEVIGPDDLREEMVGRVAQLLAMLSAP